MDDSQRDTEDVQSALVRDIEARQKNILWPDTLKNSKNVDAFLWYGSPNPRPVQRAGAIVFGLFFFVAAISITSMAIQAHFRVVVVVALVFWYLSLRILRNSFPRRIKSAGK